jgi:hypothetical protein
VNDAIDKAAAQFSSRGITAAMLHAIGQMESSNTAHPRDRYAAGEWHQGWGQLSETNQRKYGVKDPYDVYQNTRAAANLLADNLRKYHGDLFKAVKAYNGSGPDAARYAMQFAGRYMGEGQQVAPQSIIINGGVHAHVAGSNATPQDIGDAVVNKIQRMSGMQNSRNAAQMSSPYALAY